MIRQALAMLAILVAGPAYALDISAGIDCQLTVPYPGGKLIDYDFVPVTGHVARLPAVPSLARLASITRHPAR
jgi:hypothetical protein